MWLESPEGRKFIYEYARAVVLETAAEELPLFDELVDEYYKDPRPPKRSSRPTDDLLGLGVSETVIAVTPAVIAALTASLTYVLTEAIKAASDEASDAIKKKIRALFGRQPAGRRRSTRLTKAQLERIRETIHQVLVAYGLRADQADLVTDAIIGALQRNSRT